MMRQINQQGHPFSLVSKFVYSNHELYPVLNYRLFQPYKILRANWSIPEAKWVFVVFFLEINV